MNISRELIVKNPHGGKRSIFFGEATNDTEKHEIFKLRYSVYTQCGYIDETQYTNKLESDEYDTFGKSRHFIAVLKEKDETKIIGYIRLIIDNPLPTEVDFKFDEPSEISLIQRDQRGELGRFIIIPPNKATGDYLPRGLTMLFLLNVVSEYGLRNKFIGGYAFIKKSLDLKLRKSRFPIKYINNYTERYPQNGVLLKYFSQPDDPVIPIYFITHLFYEHTDRIINNGLMFRVKGNTFTYKYNLYTWFLKVIKIT